MLQSIVCDLLLSTGKISAKLSGHHWQKLHKAPKNTKDVSVHSFCFPFLDMLDTAVWCRFRSISEEE